MKLPKFLKFEKKKRDRRHLRMGTLSTVLTAVVVAVFVLLNVAADALAERYPLSTDLTAEGKFTLSEECTKVAGAVKNEVEIVLLFDQDLISSYYTYVAADYAAYGIDLTEEFDRLAKKFEVSLSQITAASDNKVSFTYLDPNQNPAEFAKYKEFDAQQGDILFLSGERCKKSSLAEMYTVDLSSYTTSGAYAFYSNVEKVLASKIYALQGEHIVQVLTGHQENQETLEGLKYLYELNGYTFEEVDITASKEFNEKAEIMLIAAPASDYSDAETRRVEEWVRNNGVYERDLIVFVDPNASCPNLYEMLNTQYGITVTDELIWETDSNRIFENNPYYTSSNVPSNKYTTHAVSEATGKYLFTPTARRLVFNEKIVEYPDELERNDAIAKIAYFLNEYPETTKVMPLGKDSDSDAITVNTEKHPLSSALASYINYANNDTQEAARGTVAVFGCPDVANLGNIQNNTFSNETLLMDVIDTMAGVEDDITITTQAYERTYLTYDIAAQKRMQYLFVVGLPAVALIVCLVVFLRRKYL